MPRQCPPSCTLRPSMTLSSEHVVNASSSHAELNVCSRTTCSHHVCPECLLFDVCPIELLAQERHVPITVRYECLDDAHSVECPAMTTELHVPSISDFSSEHVMNTSSSQAELHNPPKNVLFLLQYFLNALLIPIELNAPPKNDLFLS